MSTNRAIIVAFGMLLIAGLVPAIAAQDHVVPASAMRAAFGDLPLYFVENRSVYPDEVCFTIRGADKTLFFTDQGVTIALESRKRRWTVKLEFVGASEHARPVGLERQQAVVSYFTGDRADWRAGLRTFAKVVYRNLWPGIDLVYKGTVNELKYEFRVAPGADPGRIRLRYRGAISVEKTGLGALRVVTPQGSFEDAPPLAWQETDGARVPVAMAYALRAAGEFEFTVGDYDRTRPLVLDPAVIVYCGYIGGYANDAAGGIAVDAAGNAYVVGTTHGKASSFPVTVGPDLTPNGWTTDAFVAKVSADGKRLDYCGYIGGADDDGGGDIAVDGKGCAYVVGTTYSTEKTFPVKGGPVLTLNGYLRDVYIAKVNAAGTSLDYCGFIGGYWDETGPNVAVDRAGNAYVAGETASDETTFPVVKGPFTKALKGPRGFVAKLDPRGKFVYSGFIPGGKCTGVAVDTAGHAYLCGRANATLPVTLGPDLTHNGGSEDGYVAKVKADGSGLVYCGYLGGAKIDIARDIAVDAAGNAYVTGHTESDQNSFPVALGPDGTFNGNSNDAFVAKVSSTGKALVYCGYIGGAGKEWGARIAVDGGGSAYVVGYTGSDEKSFPVRVGPDITYNAGGFNSFIAKVSSTGAGLTYCSYIGQSIGQGVDVDVSGNAYVAGYANAQPNFPLKVGPDLSQNGRADVFVAKVAHTLLGGNGTARPGGTVNLTLSAIEDAGLPYAVGSAFGVGPMRFGTRAIALSADNLLVITVQNRWPTVFVGYQGFIAATGRAAAKINLPSIQALVGLHIHTAFITLSPAAPYGIKSISDTVSFKVRK